MQGHRVHVVGTGEAWGRELPGSVGEAEARNSGEDAKIDGQSTGKMKIAWRYEGLGEFGGDKTTRGGSSTPSIFTASHATFLRDLLSLMHS